MEKTGKIQYKELLFPNIEPFDSYSTENERELRELSLVNLFIGANNSGKSRLLRQLFLTDDLGYTTSHNDLSVYLNCLTKHHREFLEIYGDRFLSFGNISKESFTELLKTIKNHGKFFMVPDKVMESVLAHISWMTDSNREHQGTRSYMPSGVVQQQKVRLQNLGKKIKKDLESIEKTDSVFGNRKYYIPILRGMRPLINSNENLYESRTKNDYFGAYIDIPVFWETHIIFTGLELYKSLKDKLLGLPEERKSVQEYEKFLSDNFFASKPTTLIPFEKDDVVYIKIGEDNQYPIYNLGDGLQTLIIITFNIFMEKERCLFFIEEPDICMHPGYQRILLQVLAQHNQHQYFITTHSNHLLDMSLDFSDTSLFLFKKQDEGDKAVFNIKVASSGEESLLKELGVQNSSVFLTNTTIWVEGITDRLYLRAYLSKYIKEVAKTNENKAKILRMPKEDYHYTFVEYQGSNLVHWSFDRSCNDTKKIQALSMCGNPFLLMDGDAGNKGTREKIYKRTLGPKSFELLKCKEIENLMPEEILKKTIDNVFNKHGVEHANIKYEDYCNSELGIGQYLDKQKRPKSKIVFSSASSKQGTIKRKVFFCETAVDIMMNAETEWNLSPQLKKLCKKIFDHILETNNI